MTTPPSESVRRFSAGERWAHLGLAVVMGMLILTAAGLYIDPLSALIGRRRLLATIHLWSGVILPVVLVVSLVTSRALRDDTRRLNRFTADDWGWLRRALRGDMTGPSGKFNAGQKLNAAFVLGSAVVMFVTGLMLHFFDVIPVSLRTGATFVHDLGAAAVVFVSAGHLWMAWNDPVARAGLRTGLVPREWARRKHPLWEATPQEPSPGSR